MYNHRALFPVPDIESAGIVREDLRPAFDRFHRRKFDEPRAPNGAVRIHALAELIIPLITQILVVERLDLKVINHCLQAAGATSVHAAAALYCKIWCAAWSDAKRGSACDTT